MSSKVRWSLFYDIKIQKKKKNVFLFIVIAGGAGGAGRAGGAGVRKDKI